MFTFRTFHNTKLLETLNIMSHSKLNTKYVLHLLEIITLLLKEQVYYFLIENKF